MNSKVIIAVAIVLVLIGIGIAVGFNYEYNMISSTPPEEQTPRLIVRSLTEDVGVTTEP